MSDRSGNEASWGRCFASRQLSRGVAACLLVILFWYVFIHDSIVPIDPIQRHRLPAEFELTHLLPKNTSSGDWDYDWDKLSKSVKDKDKKSLVTRNVILVRHGHYDFSTGLLTKMGEIQANLTGYRLKLWNLSYSRIIHSDAKRAAQTADIIRQHLNVTVSADGILTEGGPVPPKPTISYWSLPERDYFVDGPRLESAFRKYIHRAPASHSQGKQTYDILIGHGNIFRFFILRSLQLPAEAWMRLFIAHCSITAIHINPDSTVSMSKCGDSGHFPPNLVTY